MFENGSLLRRRKRFKLLKSDKEVLDSELAALANINRFFFNPSEPVHQEIPRAPSPVEHSTCIRPKRSFTIESLISPDEPTEKAPPQQQPQCVQWGLTPYYDLGMVPFVPQVGFYGHGYAPNPEELLNRIPQVALRSV